MLPLDISFQRHRHEMVGAHTVAAPANMIKGALGLVPSHERPEGKPMSEPFTVAYGDKPIPLEVHPPNPYPTAHLNVSHELGYELVQCPLNCISGP